ncbi:MAG: ABC transporter permease [Gemmatimonadaceae bacterium]|nr:ABC transporter permease [Gemmatimonadaceae bacterium]MCW5827234.1 ABC transporter permease [Gemmatimonadaceae bacterium]
MTRWQQTLEVAHWEFTRFVKWKQQLIGLAVVLAIGIGSGFVGRMAAQAKRKPVPVAAVGAERLEFALPDAAPVAWDSTEAWTEHSARAAVENGRLKGLLLVREARDVELVLRDRAAWTDALARRLVETRQATLLARLAATTPDGAALVSPLDVRTQYTAADDGSDDDATRVAAFVILFIGATLILGGFGTMFAGITGEKQQRVTEQLVAIVPPQVWMDGKIIGLAAAAVVGTALTASAVFAVFRLLPFLFGRPQFSLPPIASAWGTLALVLVITLLGVAMWFAFMAAIAASIDDPNSSTRTLLLFAPMAPLGVALALTERADTGIAQALSLFPLTATAVLPTRLVLTTVPWWEVAASLAFLLGAVWLFRRAAGKIFGLAILTYGKEPSLREMLRWIRQA